jgi:hypothetical protein
MTNLHTMSKLTLNTQIEEAMKRIKKDGIVPSALEVSMGRELRTIAKKSIDAVELERGGKIIDKEQRVFDRGLGRVKCVAEFAKKKEAYLNQPN